jgi:hypothetical protein
VAWLDARAPVLGAEKRLHTAELDRQRLVPQRLRLTREQRQYTGLPYRSETAHLQGVLTFKADGTIPSEPDHLIRGT